MSDNEIVVQEDKGLAGSLLNFVATAVSDPNIDVAKLRELLSMQREIVGEDARVKYIQAMSACQAEIMPVVREAENKQTNSMYAKLEHVDASIRPVYTKHGFSLSFDEEAGEAENMMVVCEVSHVAGHAKKFRLKAPPDTMGPKGAPTKTVLHGRGSTVTFLRRYLTCNIFNVVLKNADDDGNRGGMRFVNQAQGEELAALIRATGTDVERFLAVMCSECQSIGEVEAKDFARLKNALLQKKNQQEKAKNDSASGGAGKSGVDDASAGETDS